MKRGGPLRRRTRLQARSSIRRARSSGRAEPERPLATWCEVGMVGVCQGRASHRHHKRGRVGHGVDSPDSTLDLCHACHAWVHANPEVSYQYGWLVRRT